MQVGKTSVSISIPELFNKYSEEQILTKVFPEVTSLPFKMCSPFRDDKKPSFSIFMDKNKHIRFKDFGDRDTKGSLLDLLCKKWDCSFNQVFDKILEEMKDGESSNVTIKSQQVRKLTRKENSEMSKIQVAIRTWKDYDYEYWGSYGITKKWLKYAEVYPISYKIVTKKDEAGKEQKYIFPADKYAYVFVERKEGNLGLKIYQPFSKDYKWCSKMDASTIGLWTKIPEKGERVVICSSLKDALCLSCNLKIPSLCLQGEGYSMSATAVKELKRRYKKVFVCFDTDAPGKADALKLCEETGFINVVPDLGKQKDLSDYWKSLEDKQQFNQLETLFY